MPDRETTPDDRLPRRRGDDGPRQALLLHTAINATLPVPPLQSAETASLGSPKYIDVRMQHPLKTLIAGETGSFELVAHLAAPDSSGMAFIEKDHPDRPYHHILAKFNPPPSSVSLQLSTK